VGRWVADLQPLAIAVIGGILASMVLSLLVTPAVHYYLGAGNRSGSFQHFSYFRRVLWKTFSKQCCNQGTYVEGSGSFWKFLFARRFPVRRRKR
jgi:hypothetical protein